MSIMGLRAEMLKEPARKNQAAWTGKAAEIVLEGAVGSIDMRYGRDTKPNLNAGTNAWSAAGWRGERMNAQFVIWTGKGLKNAQISSTDLKSESGKTIPATNLVSSWVRYVMAGEQLFPDILEPNKPIDFPASSVRPVWLNVNIPQDAEPGVYIGSLKVAADGSSELTFSLKVEVLAAILPPAKDWGMLVEIFLNPWSVADAYWAELKKVISMSVDMGCNALMTHLQPVVWADKDPAKSMIRPIKKQDGTWQYDYSIFDKYVEMGLACGLNREIKCAFPRAPIKTIHYFDEARNGWVAAEAPFRSNEYKAFWDPFIKNLAEHLKKKGWFEISTLYFDEPKGGSLPVWIEMRDRLVPEFKISVAGGQVIASLDKIYDACVILDKYERDPERNLARKKAGLQTTFYVCCFPKAPNNLVWNSPGQSAWMGWYAAAQHYTGFLRWALNNWREFDDPMMQISTGDFFLMYPGPRSSVRLERLREGFQDYEKIRIVKEKLSAMGNDGKIGLKSLDDALSVFAFEDMQGNKEKYVKVVNDGKTVLEKLTREVFSK
jgi:hypothetical protein